MISPHPTLLGAGGTGQGGPAFAHVGNLVEFTSSGTFQSTLAVDFDAVHTELLGARLDDTLTWDTVVLQPCAAHSVFGRMTSDSPPRANPCQFIAANRHGAACSTVASEP